MVADAKPIFAARVLDRLSWVDTQLEGKAYLTGDSFTVADAYLFVVTNWTKFVGIDISGLKNLGAFMGRVAARPAVQAALKAEGLLN
jgi:glutathione S-transferase